MTAPAIQYSIEKYKHRYAKWFAASAYGRSLAGGDNDLAFALIDVSGLGHVTVASAYRPKRRSMADECYGEDGC